MIWAYDPVQINNLSSEGKSQVKKQCTTFKPYVVTSPMLTLSNVITWCSVILLFIMAGNNLGLHIWGKETNNEIDARPEDSKELKIVT